MIFIMKLINWRKSYKMMLLKDIKKNCFNLMIIMNILLLMFSLIIYSFNSLNFLIVTLILLLLINFIFCIYSFKDSFLLLLFICMFFLFLCGQIIIDFITFCPVLEIFSVSTKQFIVLTLNISLVFLCASYYFFKRKETFIEYIYVKNNRSIFFMNLFLSVFIISCFFMIVKYIEMGLYLFNNGYLSIYTNFKSQLPTFCDQIANLYRLSFFSYICLFPSKKRTIYVSLIFIIISFFTLLSGGRGTLMLNVAVTLTYFFIRDNLKIDKTPFINKKTIIVFLFCIPLIIIFLNFYNNIRYGFTTINFNFLNTIKDFIYNIGGSCKVIGYAYDNQSLLTNNYYSLFPFTNLINPTTYLPNSVEIATLTNNFQYSISYIVYGARYLMGEGTGGSYIAEIYTDFGIFGICIINIFYGFFLSKFIYFFKKNYFLASLLLLSLTALFWAPRDSVFSFLTLPFESKNIFLFIFIYILYLNWNFIYDYWRKIFWKKN